MWRAGFGLITLATLAVAIVLAFKSDMWMSLLLFAFGVGMTLMILDKSFWQD